MTKPIYTQEMYDKDETPDVGAVVEFHSNDNIDFKFDWNDGDKITCVFHSTDVDGYAIGVYRHDSGVTVSLVTCLIKPLAQSIELIHGNAYQFDNIEYNTIHGIYNEDDYSFQSTSVEWSVVSCSNIKPLTV